MTVLFEGSNSGLLELTLAVEEMIPALVGAMVTVATAIEPAAILPNKAVTVPPALPIVPCETVAETNWAEARRFLSILATPLFSENRAKLAAAAVDESLPDRLTSLEPEEALALLKTIVADEAATILRLPAGSIDPLRPLSEVGMDSLMAIELRLALESRLRVDLPLVSLAEGTSVSSIASRLAGALASGRRDAEVIALVVHHELIDGGPPSGGPDREAAE